VPARLGPGGSSVRQHLDQLSAARSSLTIAEADKASLPMLAPLAIMMQPLQLGSRRQTPLKHS